MNLQPISIEEIIQATNGRLLCGEQQNEVTSVSTNSREIENGALFVPILGEKVDAHRFIPMALRGGASAVLTQEHSRAEGQNGAWIQVTDTKQALQALAAYYRRKIGLPVIGITGSVGKTSTKEMVAACLSGAKSVMKTAGNQNSQIGVPLTIFRMEKKYDLAVVEMGMSEFGEMARLSAMAMPNRAIITNIGISHIEQLKTQENIRAEKLHIIDQFDENGVLYLNGNDPLLADLKGSLPCKTVYYGTTEFCDVRAKKIKNHAQSTEFTVLCDDIEEKITIPVLGEHNVYNALAAVAVARNIGLTMDEIKKGLASYQTAAMRQQVYQMGEITVIDDTYNASPDSVKSALQVLCSLNNEGRKLAVLADMLELGDYAASAHTQAGECCAKSRVDFLLTVGKLAENMAKGAMALGMSSCKSVNTTEEAADFLKKYLHKGDAVLIKGSRGMHCDKIIQELRTYYQP